MDTLRGNVQNIDPEYFITVTYKNMPLIRPHEQLSWTAQRLQKQLDKCCDYIMIPELQMTGVIHYHGVIKITDKIKYFKSVLPWIKINCGFVKVEKIVNLENIFKYMTKEYDNNCVIFKSSRIYLSRRSPLVLPPNTTIETIISLDCLIEDLNATRQAPD